MGYVDLWLHFRCSDAHSVGVSEMGARDSGEIEIQSNHLHMSFREEKNMVKYYHGICVWDLWKDWVVVCCCFLFCALI